MTDTDSHGHVWELEEDGEIRWIDTPDPHYPSYNCTVCDELFCVHCEIPPCPGPPPPPTLKQLTEWRDDVQRRVDELNAQIAELEENQ